MSQKKLRAAVLTLILTTMILSGCSEYMAAAQTTAQTSTEQNTAEIKEEKEKEIAKAYLNDLKDAFHKYVEAGSSYSDNMTAEKYDDARNNLRDMEKALDELEKIDAPEKYVPKQSRFRGYIRPEHDYVKLCGRFLEFCERKDSLTEEDEVELKGLTDEMALASTSDFSDEFLDLVKTVKADIEE